MSESPHLQRASILSQQGRHELAEKELRAYLAEAPTDGVGHGLLAVTLNELERWDEAEKAARSAIGYDPELPFAHYALAVILLDRRKWEESIVAAEEALRGRQDARNGARPVTSACSSMSSLSWPQNGSPFSTKQGTPVASARIASPVFCVRMAATSGVLARSSTAAASKPAADRRADSVASSAMSRSSAQIAAKTLAM